MNKAEKLKLHDTNKKIYGARGLGDIPAVIAASKSQKRPETDFIAIEMLRAGYSEIDVEVEKRSQIVLRLGEKQRIEPCNSCHHKSEEVLCKKYKTGVGIRETGALECPDGKGLITVISLGK